MKFYNREIELKELAALYNPLAYFRYEDLLDYSLMVEYRKDLYASYPYRIKLPRNVSFHFF